MKAIHKKIVNDLEDLFLPIQELKAKATAIQDEKPDWLIKALKRILN